MKKHCLEILTQEHIIEILKDLINDLITINSTEATKIIKNHKNMYLHLLDHEWDEILKNINYK